MKKNCFILGIIISAGLILYAAQPCFGVPAAPVEHKLVQADGTHFSARLWGDEWSHGWETNKRYSIIFSPTTGNWHYAVTDNDGRIAPSNLIVGKDHPGPGIRPLLRPSGKAAEQIRLRRATQMSSRAESNVTTIGTGKIPVILINFRNTSTTFEASDFEALLFGTDNRTMKDYYEEVSYGKFTVSPGSAGIMGWYTAKWPSAFYGRNDSEGYDKHPGVLIREALAAADKDVDFSEYDADGDCYCDVVAIIHQGGGEEAGEEASGTSKDIWSHRWDLNSAKDYGDGRGEYVTNDTAPCGSIKINDYIIQPEMLLGEMGTMGVFAHEYAHSLGLPDFYDIDYSSEGLGDWCLMAGGSWTYVDRPGDSPSHMNAWCKYFLGWVSPTRVTGMLTDETIQPAALAGDVYQFLPGSPETGGEYFLVENRQRIGFDAGLPGSGLAVWHVDELWNLTFSNQNNSNECLYPGQCPYWHYHVALVQADRLGDIEKYINAGDAGDLFPGSTANSAFTDNSTPNSRLYYDIPSNISLTDIIVEGTDIIATMGYMKQHDIVIGLGPSSYGWFDIQDTYSGAMPVSHRDWAVTGFESYNEANGETRIAAGDIDGDGKDEIVIGLGPVEGLLQIPDGMFEVLDDDYSPLTSGRIDKDAYNVANGETYPACGDVDGDGRDEIIMGLGSYAADGGWVEIFDFDNGSLSHKTWLSAGTAAYNAANGETHPACGDVDGDGRDEIVIGFSIGGEGRFEVYDDSETGYAILASGSVDLSGYAAANGATWPACGDVDGDGRDEIIMGLGAFPSDGSRLEVFEYDSGTLTHMAWIESGWDEYNSTNGETRPVCADIDSDGRDEIIIGFGTDGDGRIQILDDHDTEYAHMTWAYVDSPIYRSAGGETRPAVKKLQPETVQAEAARLSVSFDPDPVPADVIGIWNQKKGRWEYSIYVTETNNVGVTISLFIEEMYDEDGELVGQQVYGLDDFSIFYYLCDTLDEYIFPGSRACSTNIVSDLESSGGTYRISFYGIDDNGNKVSASGSVELLSY